MRIYGQIIRAQLENLAAAPSPAADGMVYYDTTLLQVRYYNGTTWKTVADLNTAQVLTAKDIDGGTASNTSRITIPKDTYANLLGLTRKAGTIVYATDQNKAYIDNGSALTEIGSGSGGGGVNYVTNGDAEEDTTGWSLYADGAADPVDGTGGAATATFTRSTSNPLRGQANFLFTAGGLGNGVAYTITPDRADIKNGAVVTVSCEYEPSGTLAEGDYRIWIYDVANSALIQPAPYKIPSGVAGVVYKWKGEFQLPTNGTTFRVLVHQAVASPANLKIDSIVLGPDAKSYGPPVTDWQSYTPTVSGLGAGSSTNAGWYRRVGDTLQVKVRINKDATPGSGASVVTMSLPPGLSADTAKLSASYQVGSGVFHDANFGYDTEAMLSSGALAIRRVGTGSNFTGANFTANGEVAITTAFVPILGWSSSVQVSSDAATQVITAIGMRASTHQTITQGSASEYNTIIFNSVVNDTSGMLGTGTGLFTAKVSGYYDYKGAIQAELVTNNALASREIVAGSIGKYIGYKVVASANAVETFPIAGQVYLTAGQTFGIQVNQYNAGAFQIYTGATWLAVTRVSGPSQIAASETVAATYELGGGSSSASMADSTNTTIDFNVKLDDSHGSVTTGAAWKFTAAVSGRYRVSAGVEISATAGFNGTTEVIDLLVWYGTSGASNRRIDIKPGNPSAPTVVNGSTTVRLLAGDIIQIKASQNSGGAATVNAGSTYVSIERIGNY